MLWVVLSAAAGCSAHGEVHGEAAGPVVGAERFEGSTTTSSTTTTGPPSTSVDRCPPLGPATTVGTIGDPSVTEASGLAVGVRSPGVLYTHNDSGGAAEVAAMAFDGRPLGTYRLAGAEAVDWEDMAVGPGPDPGISYLYLGDIGDNTGTRSTVTVYRAPEPMVPTGEGGPSTLTIDEVARFELTYPDGVARDAEALLVDPDTGDVMVVTKTLAPSSEVFRFRPGPRSASVTLESAGTVAVPSPGLPWITGGSVSGDGRWVALRTYDRLLRFARPPGTPLAAALAGTPCVDPLPPQRQGEAVALSPTGDAVVTTSEGPSAAIQVQQVGGG